MQRTVVLTLCDARTHEQDPPSAQTTVLTIDGVTAEVDLCDTDARRLLDELRDLVHGSERVLSGTAARLLCEVDGCRARFTTGARRNEHYRAEHPALAPNARASAPGPGARAKTAGTRARVTRAPRTRAERATSASA